MSIFLAGETIDAKTAHKRAQDGELVQLMRGVYVAADADIESAVFAYAIRIAHYLYPSAYLSAASAHLLRPSDDGRLFISGKRNQRTRLRGLEIVQNEASPQPETVTAIVGDPQGEIRIAASSLRQRFLEAFRLRSEHASAMTEPLRREAAQRLIDIYGSPPQAADALWALARANQWYREGEGAERYLLTERQSHRTSKNAAALELHVLWHGAKMGNLVHDGFDWRWTPTNKRLPPIIRQTTPGKLPPMIDSLLPEGWLAQILQQRDERDALRHGRRYMSNILIGPNLKQLHHLPEDKLSASLSKWVRAGRFTGRYRGPAPTTLEQRFEQNLARLYATGETPRLSGVQIKAPMHLNEDGELLPATALPFTHILKPAGSGGFEGLPLAEWLCLTLGKMSGLDVPPFALVSMPDPMPPALLIERFDIRRDAEDRRMIALEDFCSVLDQPPAAKYDGTIERVAKALRALSTAPSADLKALFRRAVFAWLVADGDMHLKNLSLLREAFAAGPTFTSVRLAPLYDSVTTRVFPGLAHDRMALKLNGKDDRLTRKDFKALAKTMDLPMRHAEAILDDLLSRIKAALPKLKLPRFVRAYDQAEVLEGKVKKAIEIRCANLQEKS